MLTSGGDDGSVDSDNDWPLELGLEMLNDLFTDFAERSKRSEGGSNQEVLGLGSISCGVLNLLGRVDVEKLEVGLNISVVCFEVLKSLGDVFFKFSNFDLFTVRVMCVLRRSS